MGTPSHTRKRGNTVGHSVSSMFDLFWRLNRSS